MLNLFDSINSSSKKRIERDILKIGLSFLASRRQSLICSLKLSA